MKKALLSLLLVMTLLPFAKAQDNVQRVIVARNVVACDTWNDTVNGIVTTYTADTVITTVTTDTLYVTNLTIGLSSNETLAPVTAGCSYEWNRQVLTSNGTYTDTLQSVLGCDSIITFALTLTGIEYDTTEVSTCGEYVWNNDTLIATGIYTDTTHATACDSVHVLNLSVVASMTASKEVRNCGNYIWYGDTLTATGVYNHTAADTVAGCDTLYTLNLTIFNDTVNTVDSACAVKNWRGNPYTATGIYTDYDTNRTTQCVTVRNLDLTIKPARIAEYDTTVSGCSSVTYTFMYTRRSTMTFTESGLFDTTFTNHAWATCLDSTLHLNVNIKQSTDTTLAPVTACTSYTWDVNNKTYTKDTLATYKTGRNAVGCDSNMRVQIYIKPSPVISAINGEWSLQQGDTAKLSAEVTPGASHLWTYGNNQTSTADTLIIPNLQENTDVTLVATITTDGFACRDTSWITITTYVGIDEIEGTSLSLYPNPTVGQLNVESSSAVASVVIYNMVGQQVATQYGLGNKGMMNLSNLSNGSYTMQLVLENGNTITRKFVISK